MYQIFSKITKEPVSRKLNTEDEVTKALEAFIAATNNPKAFYVKTIVRN